MLRRVAKHASSVRVECKGSAPAGAYVFARLDGSPAPGLPSTLALSPTQPHAAPALPALDFPCARGLMLFFARAASCGGTIARVQQTSAPKAGKRGACLPRNISGSALEANALSKGEPATRIHPRARSGVARVGGQSRIRLQCRNPYVGEGTGRAVLPLGDGCSPW
jgi:hypothetical protein